MEDSSTPIRVIQVRTYMLVRATGKPGDKENDKLNNIQGDMKKLRGFRLCLVWSATSRCIKRFYFFPMPGAAPIYTICNYIVRVTYYVWKVYWRR